MRATSGQHPRSVPGVLRSPGSQTALRERNQQRIIDSLLDSGPLTQADLARRTGLSAATISNIVNLMAAAGTVETERTTSSGRRAFLVRMADNGKVAIGIDFGRSHVRVVVATVGYWVVAEESVELPLQYAADVGVDTASRLLSRLLEKHNLAPSAVLRIGLGIPAPIDQRSGTVVQDAILPEWLGMRLQDLEDGLGFPVSFDNDANLGALAEVTWGQHSSVENLVFIKIGSGIGAGLILNGKAFHGSLGVSGEIGHEIVVENGVQCRCGNSGCLETVASTSAMLSALSGQPDPPLTAAEIVRDGLRQDPATIEVLNTAGLLVGRALGSVANLLNPEVIVVGGPLAALGDSLLDPIRLGLREHAMPGLGGVIRVVVSSLGERAEALGAAALALQGSDSRI
jgi:predicted NBD/HSP70 family sugar kinase